MVSGQETDSSGAYDVTISATAGDRLEIWYLDGNDRSPPTTVVVPKAPNSAMGGAGGTAQ
jgi:hypothetical protein